MAPQAIERRVDDALAVAAETPDPGSYVSLEELVANVLRLEKASKSCAEAIREVQKEGVLGELQVKQKELRAAIKRGKQMVEDAVNVVN